LHFTTTNDGTLARHRRLCHDPRPMEVPHGLRRRWDQRRGDHRKDIHQRVDNKELS
jgi:hypothetical protein